MKFQKKYRAWNYRLKGEEYYKHYKNGHPRGMLGKKHSEESKIKNKISMQKC